jgi:hypothetical protein
MLVADCDASVNKGLEEVPFVGGFQLTCIYHGSSRDHVLEFAVGEWKNKSVGD